MPFLSGALESSATTLHFPDHDETLEPPTKRLRKSQSHASIVAPLLRLARNPVGSLGGLLENLVIKRQDVAETRPEHEKGTRSLLLKQRMKDATEYAVWKDAALELDNIEGNEDWKQDPKSPFYDNELLQLRLQQLNEARTSGDPKRMLFLLRTSLTRGLGNMGDLNLYKSSHFGTKALIEDYISATCETLEVLLQILDREDNIELESRFALERLLETRQSFGRSALLLSGGGTFGMTHIGVVKCLWEEKLLPRIVCGSSAGSIVCAVLCARTDAEVPATLQDMCTGDLDVFEKSGQEESLLRKAVRFAKYGAVFDIQHLTGVMRGLLGDLTFQEAYNRTRRILNISVSSANLHELPRLLNYITAPNVIIWSAVAASCSVPLVFSPATILAKDPKTGAEVHWNPSPQFWIDGSVDSDLPMTRLSEMFNVNHFIVSQVNPHVIPFLVEEETMLDQTTGGETNHSLDESSSVLHTLASLAKNEALHRMHVLAELGVFPNYFTKLRSVLSQKYSGDITIIPEIAYPQFIKILQNPSPEFMLTAMLAGERATWPKLSRIQNHCAIELALDNAVQKLRTYIAFSPSQVDLRMMSYSGQGQITPQSNDTERPRRRQKTKSWISDPRYFHRSSPFNKMTTISFLQQQAQDLEANDSSDFASDNDLDNDGEEQFLSLKSHRRPRPRANSKRDSVYDSSESNFRSYSPSSEQRSQDESDVPPLKPPRQFSLHISQPSTPFLPRRRSSSNTQQAHSVRWVLSPASDEISPQGANTQPEQRGSSSGQQQQMSDAERQYRRLFHRSADGSPARMSLARTKSSM